MELGVVTGRMTDMAKDYYLQLQSLNSAKIVSHTHKHFDNTIPSSYEFLLGIENCDDMGFISDGIIYQTGDYNNPDIFAEAIDMGYLICGYLYGIYGRNGTYMPLGAEGAMLDTNYSIKPFPVKGGSILAKTPILGVTNCDDIYNMVTNQSGAYNKFVNILTRADTYPYDLPLIFYFHDSPLANNWNGSSWAGTYYDIANGMDRRIQYYNDVFNYIDSLGYKQIKRSISMELIYDIMNCASVTSEVIAATGVTIKIVSKRRICGLTVAIPTEETMTISRVTIDNGIIDNSLYERSSDSRWVYVSVEALPGKEHNIVVTYA